MRLTATDHLLIRASMRTPGYSLLLLLGAGTTTATSLLMPAALAAAANAVLTHRAATAATIWLAALLALGALSSLATGLAGTIITTTNTRWLSNRLIRHARARLPRYGWRTGASAAPSSSRPSCWSSWSGRR